MKQNNDESKANERTNLFAAKKKKDSKFQTELKSNKSVICPTCGRKAREYKRKLTPQLCVALIEVLKWYRHNPNEVSTLDYFELDDIFKDNPKLKVDFSKLQYWDLIEAKGKLVRGKFVKNYGWYRISDNGVKFAQREVAVPVTAIVYNNEVKGHVINPHSTIEQILSEAEIDYDFIIDPKNKIRYA
jgi:hypothetical protein